VGNEVKPETLRRKSRACETLPEFLARMTLVWEERQRRLAEAPKRAVAATQRWNAKARAADPEGYRLRKLEAVNRYAAAHPERLIDKRRRAAERLAVERAARRAMREFDKLRKRAAVDAKHGKRPEGYPKVRQRPLGGAEVVQPTAVADPHVLARAWSSPSPSANSCPEKRSSAALASAFSASLQRSGEGTEKSAVTGL
jgi:hypothetical protein